MKLILIALCCIALSAAAPANTKLSKQLEDVRSLPALQHEETHDEFGQYSLYYVTAEGTVVSERGHLVPSAEGNVLVVEGEVSYVSDDGNTYVTKYSAGLGGSHIEGAHLPVAPKVVVEQ